MCSGVPLSLLSIEKVCFVVTLCAYAQQGPEKLYYGKPRLVYMQCSSAVMQC